MESNLSLLAIFVELCEDPSVSNVSDFWKLDGIELISGQVAAAFLILFLLIGLPLNLTAMVVILKKRLYKQPSLLLMFNLMLSDLIVIVLVIPVQLSTAISGEFLYLAKSDRSKCRLCKIGFIYVAFVVISLLTVAFMSFDRFLFIYKPLRYNQFLTSVRVLIILIVMWIFSIVYAILPLVGFGSVVYDEHSLTCVISISGELSVTNRAYSSLTIILYALPVTAIVIFNSLVIYIVQKNIRAIYKYRRSRLGDPDRQAQSNQRHREVNKKRHQKQLHLVRVFGGLMLANLVSWMPSIIISLIAAFAGKVTISPLITVGVLFFMMQVATHPIVEIALLKDIKDPIMDFFCFFRRKRPPNPRTETSSCCCRRDDDMPLCGCAAIIQAAILKQLPEISHAPTSDTANAKAIEQELRIMTPDPNTRRNQEITRTTSDSNAKLKALVEEQEITSTIDIMSDQNADDTRSNIETTPNTNGGSTIDDKPDPNAGVDEHEMRSSIENTPDSHTSAIVTIEQEMD